MSSRNKEEDPTVLLNFLSQLGLERFHPNKLTLRSLLEINRNSVYDEAVSSVEDIPWCFLRKLFQINAECRNCTQLSNKDDEEENNDVFDLDLYTAEDSADNKVNLLDLMVALFLCADSFLQQEMALKMSMCQFSVPLVLPHGNNSQSTLMVWALRDIVKEWRPHEMSSSKGFVEENIVQTELPFFSFVRLRNCSLSKSQCLNHILSIGQYNNNMFIHRDMKGGDHDRKISNGLVEVCWYLPYGKENTDKFSKPIAVANLRGDIGGSLTQFSFLFQVSTATFVFLDKVEENEHKILTSLQDVKDKLFLVVNRKGDNTGEDMMTVGKTAKELHLPQSCVKIKEPHVNLIKFSETLSDTIKKSMRNKKPSMTIVNMLDKAVELGLSEDESKSDNQKKAAEEIVKGIGAQSIPEYKNTALPLQGDKLKRLSQLEMEECRLKHAGDLDGEKYKSQLQTEKQEIIKELGKHKLSKAMNSFIKQSSEQDKVKRDFFLKWMKLKLNANSQLAITLRHKLTEEGNKKQKDGKQIAELDRALLESSLGIEHYMREMGLIYEFSSQSQHTDDKISRLPGLAAEMLLDGYPLELLDGDASNIPQRWVTDVLTELHNKVGGESRLLVLTVLGVQSTGKSTLLNTMFGVQFPVSSGRCTRGAYMLFLRVGDDMQSELNYDFIVLIDTEGLRSPCLAQLEDSCEHDNQLATFVIGLSDVTIINVAMENSTEMKDFLQIATHAFLRMKQVGKKPVCHFVHQNVGGVSAHANTKTERKHLLEQLNEMTKIAAEMEKHPSIQLFTDVLDYDLEKNNWNIPGLWHGTPPMAPVNTGYSEAVADFKKNLLETVKRDTSDLVADIPEFLEWIKSLWRAVKFENFIFSFRNTLVAHAYDNLCKDFNQWEWEFRKEISRCERETEMEIQNVDNESELHQLNEIVESKKSKVSDKIAEQQTKMHQKLQDYFKRKDRHVNLIMKYKTDFFIRIDGLTKEIQHSANNDLDCALECKKSSKQAENLQRKHREVIEEQVMKLLSDCKKRKKLSDEELKEEFEKVWAAVTVNISGLKEQDIPAKVLDQLRREFVNLNVNEELQNITDLQETGKGPFEAKTEHVKKANILNYIFQKDVLRELQSLADSVIASCTRFVQDAAKTDRDYHDSLTKELLEKVDESLKESCNKFKPKFDIDLKVHVCGFASREFLDMHRNYLAQRDPKIKLEEKKKQYMTDFIDLYKERDDSQRKATDYVRFCIKPAVEEYISRSLGVDIVDDILTSCHSPEYSSRSFFQYNIQEELLHNDDFESFVKYITNYEICVKDWIFQHVLQKMSEGQTLCELKDKILHVIVDKIKQALEQSTKRSDGTLLPDNQESIQELIKNMRQYLNKDISISVEEEKTILFQIQSKFHQFTENLFNSVNELKEELQEEFSNSGDISETLEKLPTKPQDELFKRVFGCGKQCPFCNVPCEAGGKEHSKHHAAVHRPQGLGRYRSLNTQKLNEKLCTTDVHSECTFRNADTEWKDHPYKDYTTYYPDWHIPPDRTIQASDYWKYVLVKYNDRFAEVYEAKPADVPEQWRSITKEQALTGLKEAFNMK